jgi:hypothetical protein
MRRLTHSLAGFSLRAHARTREKVGDDAPYRNSTAHPHREFDHFVSASTQHVRSRAEL